MLWSNVIMQVCNGKLAISLPTHRAHACTRRVVAWLGNKSTLLTAMTSRGASLCSCACAVAKQDQSVCSYGNDAQSMTILRRRLLVLLLHTWTQAQSDTSAGLPCSSQALILLAHRFVCKALVHDYARA
jgi:hypothetical protein